MEFFNVFSYFFIWVFFFFNLTCLYLIYYDFHLSCVYVCTFFAHISLCAHFCVSKSLCVSCVFFSLYLFLFVMFPCSVYSVLAFFLAIILYVCLFSRWVQKKGRSGRSRERKGGHQNILHFTKKVYFPKRIFVRNMAITVNCK